MFNKLDTTIDYNIIAHGSIGLILFILPGCIFANKCDTIFFQNKSVRKITKIRQPYVKSVKKMINLLVAQPEILKSLIIFNCFPCNPVKSRNQFNAG